MRKAIFKVMVIIVLITLVLTGGIMAWQIYNLKGNIDRSSKAANEEAVRISADAISEQISARLSENARGNAEGADVVFADLSKAITLIAEGAEDMYRDPKRYGRAKVAEPKRSMMGKGIVAQVVYSPGVDKNDPEIAKEQALIGNLQGVITALYDRFPQLASAYIATESGIMIMSEEVSESRFDTDGSVLPFEARERGWYIGAKESGKLYFTGVFKDADSDNTGIVAAIPVKKDGEVVAVVGAGMFLDAVSELVKNADIGKDGTSCIINDQGSVIFSTRDSGILKTDDGTAVDIREGDIGELKDVIDAALSGSADVAVLPLDGENSYVAYSPMNTVGWSFFSIMPEETVQEPTMLLKQTLGESNEARSKAMDASMATMGIILLVFGVVIVLVVLILSNVFAGTLVKPIVALTHSVAGLEGDDLEFEWNMETHDEIQTLANSFGSMTERMKNYIKNIQEITAEKERIGAELNVATKIQADMLPRNFSDISVKKEVDLYAVMDPAKEVGGDFYDFFLIDDDHLALVMSDVSGKGVPAALFMVIAKTLLKNHLQSGATVAEALTATNDQLSENNEEMLFVTSWIGIVDLKTGEVKFADAGHETTLILHPDGNVEEIVPKKKKMPLACMEGIPYLEDNFTVKDGDIIFLYTDGVPEATSASEELYGMERLEAKLAKCVGMSPEELLKAVRKDVDEFVGTAPQFDDLTMLGCKITL